MVNEITQYSLKFRPHYFKDVFGQDATVTALRKRVLTEDFPSAVLFQGPFGCGKTSIAQIFAAAMQAHTEDGEPDWNNPSCKSILSESFDRDTIRLDGAQLSGKSDVVDFMKDINMKPLFDKYRIVIIEEIDQISSAGISSLLKILEGLKPWTHVILLSMEDKVSGAVKSRCQVYQIKSLDKMSIMKNLKHIMEQTGDWSNPNIPDSFRLEGLNTIADASQGSMRSAVQFLEKCIINEAYDPESVSDLLGVMDDVQIWKVLDALLLKTKDETILRKIIWMKQDEVSHFYMYSTMMLAEALLLKETGVACDEQCEPRLRKLASSPHLESLYYCLTLNPQMSKPYMRSSDLVGAIACYYQGIDFRPSVVNFQTITSEVKEIPTSIVSSIDNSNTVKQVEHVQTRTVAPTRPTPEKKIDLSSLHIEF